MKRVYQIEGTQIKRTSETHDYTHAVVYLKDHWPVSVWHMCGSYELAQIERIIRVMNWKSGKQFASTEEPRLAGPAQWPLPYHAGRA